MFRQTLLAATVGAVALALAQTASAGPTIPLGAVTLEDDDGEVLFRFNNTTSQYERVTSGTVQVGDVLAAVITIDEVINRDTSTSTDINPSGQITGLALTEITTLTANVVDQGPAGSAAWSGIFGVDVTAAGFGGLSGGAEDRVVSLFFSDDDEDVNLNTLGFSANAAAASDSAFLFAAGFGTGVDGIADGASDFFTATNAFPGTIDLTTALIEDLSDIDDVILNFNFGLSALAFGPNFGVAQEAEQFGLDFFDFAGQGGTVRGNPSPGGLRNADFQFATDVDIDFVRVPTPTTLALLGVGLIGAGFAASRRRRQSA